LKILQDSKEESWHLPAKFHLTGIERRPDSPKSVILLLHGLDERGLRIYRKLIKFLPEDSYVLAPNAPFPLPRMKADRIDLGYTWYFYDKFTQSYQVDQSFSLSLLQSLLAQANPENLPVTIIGFSQGGYLAPLVGFQEKNTRQVIGIGCEFRNHFFSTPPHYKLFALHGASDSVIPADHAKNEIDLLANKGINVSWHPIHSAKHEITREMGQEVQKILES
jgi:predicted esterase